MLIAFDMVAFTSFFLGEPKLDRIKNAWGSILIAFVTVASPFSISLSACARWAHLVLHPDWRRLQRCSSCFTSLWYFYDSLCIGTKVYNLMTASDRRRSLWRGCGNMCSRLEGFS